MLRFLDNTWGKSGLWWQASCGKRVVVGLKNMERVGCGGRGTGQWVEHQWAGVPSRVLKQKMWGWHYMEGGAAPTAGQRSQRSRQ